jgi:hypothetical protein
MIFNNPNKRLVVDPSRFLYKWNKSYGSYQKKYFTEPIIFRREKAIEDFIKLNEFKKVKFDVETDILHDAKRDFGVECNQDLTVIASQKFSRYSCPVIIDKINQALNECPRMYLCLTRWYINIDNSYIDPTLDNNFLLAITQWIKKSLDDSYVIDLSLDHQEDGKNFTWVIPDRHYYIQRHYA